MTAFDLAVVVPSVNGYEDLCVALTALMGQTDVRLQTIVVDRCGETLRERVRAEFPSCTVLAVPTRTTIPAMRRAAFTVADADAIAVIEDHVVVPVDWARRMLDLLSFEQAGGATVVGGAVENLATDSLIDWTAFLCEYSHCLPPLPAGEVNWLTGNNVIYPRSVLVDALGDVPTDAWENVIHEAMRSRGVRLVCHPEVVVGHRKFYSIAEYGGQRFLYARAFAGARIRSMTPLRRVAYGLAACALPAMLFARIVHRVWRSGKHRRELFAGLPLLGAFVIAWGAGESVGAFLGPGDALGRVR